MSQLSNFAENKLVDMLRGQAWSLPADLYFGLASVSDDTSSTELAGSGYGRIVLSRSLTNWAGTQGAGTTAASSGTSHASSNNVLMDWGTSGAAWGTADYVVVYDATTGGNALCRIPLQDSLVVGSGVPVTVAIGAVAFTLGLSGGCSDYLANKLIDFIFRGQAFTFPATMYAGLLTAAPTNAGGGTEVGGGVGYGRAAIAGSLVNWAGTQGAGTTVASTGTTGVTSNNVLIAFPAPSGSWGTVGWTKYMDAASAGNMLFWAPLASAKTVGVGSTPPSFAAASQTIAFA